MQQHVRKPLRLLRHDNYATFAEIFTTALLQAAATGETLVGSDQSKSDKVLQKQADKDASKIFRLNQRMQVSCHAPYLGPTPPFKIRGGPFRHCFPFVWMVHFLVYCKHPLPYLDCILTLG